VPAPKKAKPLRYGIAFWVENKDQEILLEKRPPKGLLAGLIGLPTTLWRQEPWDLTSEETINYAPKGVDTWERFPNSIRHTFTHFHLELQIVKGRTTIFHPGIWSSVENLKSHALPTIMKKVIRAVSERIP